MMTISFPVGFRLH